VREVVEQVVAQGEIDQAPDEPLENAPGGSGCSGAVSGDRQDSPSGDWPDEPCVEASLEEIDRLANR
jgi:hypothetical protein